MLRRIKPRLLFGLILVSAVIFDIVNGGTVKLGKESSQMSFKTFHLEDPNVNIRRFRDVKKAKEVNSQIELFGLETEVVQTKSELRAIGSIVNPTDQNLILVLDGFGLGVQFDPTLNAIGPQLAPAPPLPFSVEVPSRSKLVMKRSFSLKNFDLKKGEKYKVEIFLVDIFGKILGPKAHQVLF